MPSSPGPQPGASARGQVNVDSVDLPELFAALILADAAVRAASHTGPGDAVPPLCPTRHCARCVDCLLAAGRDQVRATAGCRGQAAMIRALDRCNEAGLVGPISDGRAAAGRFLRLAYEALRAASGRPARNLPEN